MRQGTSPAWLLERSREFNGDIHRAFWEEGLPLECIGHHVRVIAERLYREQPHWHQFRGPCMRDIPFEVNMQALALLACTWVADIYLRKARDRDGPGMASRCGQWRNLLTATLDHVEHEVASSRDPDAKAAWKRDRRPTNRWRCFINRVLWRH